MFYQLNSTIVNEKVTIAKWVKIIEEQKREIQELRNRIGSKDSQITTMVKALQNQYSTLYGKGLKILVKISKYSRKWSRFREY
jgi:hypothetical protein